ncbi:hypothetical protein [Lactobacillus brevis] [Lactiplantibacillus mudanjiangensis]|uniref:ribosomal-processing cysteine protease Prp n=1 Tax=Lactiplantibacillus mudanjiangensis TaxID=1296538 RepID=UPI0010151E6B|nr:hypothetical protein [Lactobacillus brevis] [Lactiplantibacillus mudanjiangensis]
MIQATMTETRLTKIAELKITGHALSAPYGHDIVCASVSTLCSVLSYSFDPIFRDDGDTFLITASLAQRGNQRLWAAVKANLEQLSKQYPENVKFKHVLIHG